jgi:hypothetical protein
VQQGQYNPLCLKFMMDVMIRTFSVVFSSDMAEKDYLFVIFKLAADCSIAYSEAIDLRVGSILVFNFLKDISVPFSIFF